MAHKRVLSARTQQGKMLADEYAAMVKSSETGWLAALSAFQGLRGDSRLALNDKHYNIMIHACSKAHQWERALDMFGQMQDKRFRPNNHTFTHLINACGGAADGLMCRRVYASMIANRVRPNSYTATAMITALSKTGDWETGLHVLADAERMPAMMRANAFTYNSAIDACRKADQWDICWKLFNRMQYKGETPAEYTYTAMLNAAADAKKWEAALKLVRLMRRQGFTTSVQHKDVTRRAFEGAPPEAVAAMSAALDTTAGSGTEPKV